MPRSRRRHHSRSRSNSHDRETKRRRVDSPDSSHHRRSMSVESDYIEEMMEAKDVTGIPSNESSNSTHTEVSECDRVNRNQKEKYSERKNDECDIEKNNKVNQHLTSHNLEVTNKSKNNEVLSETKLEKTQTDIIDKVEIKIISDVLFENDRDEKICNKIDDDEDDDDDNDTVINPADDSKCTINLDESSDDKNLSRSTSKFKKLSKIEREQFKQKEKEERARVKQEKEEQRLKEKKEKEEMKSNERKAKEEQRKKEKEEREELKKKEREEKEELRRKEKEEREELKRKEKEEKEEQKRKEREQRDLKKQQELDEKNKKHVKEAAAFVNFFVSKKSTNSLDSKKCEATSSVFKDFEVKFDMRLAPLARIQLTDTQKTELLDKIQLQHVNVLYLDAIKSGITVRKSYRTWPVEDDDVVILEDNDIGECVEEEHKIAKMRAKFFKFHENKRPAYFGTWRKKSAFVSPRRPFAQDKTVCDYDVDSDDDWEEEEPGESLRGSDDEEKENDPDEYEIDDKFVPHGYLSDDEADDENDLLLTPESQKEKLKILQLEFDEEMNHKTEKLKPRIIGSMWENKNSERIINAINTYLDKYMMIGGGPIILKKRMLITSRQTSASKISSTRRQFPQDIIPDFLQLIHGNTNNKVFLVNEFLNYLHTKKIDIAVSKAGLCQQLKQLAKWTKCPEEGIMYNKYCWYVHEDIRTQFNSNLILPNKWLYTNTEDTMNSSKKGLNMT